MCVRDYKDEKTGLEIPKGAVVNVPVNAIHHDKEYYEKPDEFYPEHFSPEKKAARNPYAFMPFGIGPRNCIGECPSFFNNFSLFYPFSLIFTRYK